ncbi:MAG: lamin tail domain-containing protein [Bacteroidota bacterium]
MRKVLLTVAAIFAVVALQAQCSDLLISEYVEGGGNNKAIEIYNASNSPILLSDYQVCRYSNGSGTPNCVTLQDVYLEPDSVHVGVLDKRDPNGTGYDTMVDPQLQAKADSFYTPVYSINKTFYWNGNDAVSLELTDGTLIDLMGEIGVDPGLAWTMDANANYTSALGGRWWTRNHTLVRKATVKTGVTTNPSPFIVANEWDSLPYNTFDHLGWHNCECHDPNSVNNYEKPAHKMLVYPNPVIHNEVMVKATAAIEDVKIVDLTGRIVLYRSNEGEESSIRLENLGISQGVYMINTRLEDGTTISKKIYVQ